MTTLRNLEITETIVDFILSQRKNMWYPLNRRLGGFISSESTGEGNNTTLSENRIPDLQ
jgi:hypothetical protein